MPAQGQFRGALSGPVQESPLGAGSGVPAMGAIAAVVNSSGTFLLSVSFTPQDRIGASKLSSQFRIDIEFNKSGFS